MARKNSRLVLNRQALDAVRLGLGDGMLSLTQEVIAATHPPDAEPFGQGLITTGDSGSWVNGKKIGGGAAKPRGVRMQRNGVTGLVGYGFPGRFQELGTINHAAQPFLTPGVDRVLPEAAGHLRAGVKRRVR